MPDRPPPEQRGPMAVYLDCLLCANGETREWVLRVQGIGVARCWNSNPDPAEALRHLIRQIVREQPDD